MAQGDPAALPSPHCFYHYLIVPLVLRVELVHVLVSAQQTLDLVQRPPRADLLHLLDVAVAVDTVLGVGPAPAAAVEAVGVGGGLAVAEVAAVSAPADAPGHATLLYRLADHHTVLLELLGQDGVQEGVAAAVQGQYKDREHLQTKATCEGKVCVGGVKV